MHFFQPESSNSLAIAACDTFPNGNQPMTRSTRLTMLFAAIAWSIPGSMLAQADDATQPSWPPTVDSAVETKPFPGRKVEFFRHGSLPEWGYAQTQQDYFILVHPENPHPDSPLYVVLHSAGHDAKSAFEIATEGPEGPRGHFLYYPPADCYGLYPDCRANGGGGDWWWGGPQPNETPPKNLGPNPTPTEKRVEATVRWVLSQYSTDANRVHLTGISMGGSGSLGIGVPRGSLFASILVHVPAGALHIEERMQFPPTSTVAGTAPHSDPPVVVAYSGVDDGWANDQAVLLKGMHDGKYAFIDFWGRSGHDSTKQAISSQCDLAFSFPWLEIKKNEAYPAFTDASSDSKVPWLVREGEAADSTGQINAFFRWKKQEDAATSFAMELRLLKPDEVQSTMAFPTESTADVTLRRLQNFHVGADQECHWELVQAGAVIAHGKIRPDSAGLLTIPRLTIQQTPSLLKLKTQ